MEDRPIGTAARGHGDYVSALHVTDSALEQVPLQGLLHGGTVPEHEGATDAAGQGQVDVRRADKDISRNVKDVTLMHLPKHL
jgi:hypothetical protein